MTPTRSSPTPHSGCSAQPRTTKTGIRLPESDKQALLEYLKTL